jgi:hypothetical protein
MYFCHRKRFSNGIKNTFALLNFQTVKELTVILNNKKLLFNR